MIRLPAALLPLLLLLLAATPARAVDWLVLVIDRSNSVDDRELALQRQAYVNVLSDPNVVAAIGDGQVAMIEFDRYPELVVDWTDPLSAAQRYARPRAEGLRGQTAIGDALERAMALLEGKAGHRVIDVSGDGPENIDERLLRKMRAFAMNKAIDINCLAILSEDEPDLDDYYRTRVSTGFVLTAEGQDDFERALRRKLDAEVAGRTGAPSLLQKASFKDPASTSALR